MIFGLIKDDKKERDDFRNYVIKEFSEISKKLESKPDKLDKDAYERLADLEVKMAKLWSLLVEQNSFGKEKLTKFGRLFGGKARQDIQ